MQEDSDNTYLVTLAFVLALMASACAGPATEPTPSPPPEAVQAALRSFSDQTGIPASDISIVSFSETEWPNACLGLGEEGEMCAQVITPGWQVMVQTQGQEYEILSDLQAGVVRYQSTDQSEEAANPVYGY